MKPKTRNPDGNAKGREELDAGFREALGSIEKRFKDNPDFSAWLRLYVILDDAMSDKVILTSRAATKFLEVVRELAADSYTCNDAIQALRPLGPVLAGDQLRDNTGRIKGGDTMKQLKAAHTKHLTTAVVDILKNPKTSDWKDPDIARWLMEPGKAYHERKGKTPLGHKTMTTRVKEIRAAYKASI